MSKIQAARANTLEGFLNELPELPSDYFSYPVDDFFDNYVEELGQRGLQQTTQPGGGEFLIGSDCLPNSKSLRSRAYFSTYFILASEMLHWRTTY